MTFPESIFKLLSKREPTAQELKIFELILNLSIDHGPDTPSAKVVIEKAQSGSTLSEALSAGVLEINDAHGGAQELLMPLLYQIVTENKEASQVVKEFVGAGKRLPGFGHRIYKEVDPRAENIFASMNEEGMGEEFISAICALKIALEEQSGKNLPINIDGAIAVALCTFGWRSSLGKAVFIIARTPGLCGQYLNARS